MKMRNIYLFIVLLLSLTVNAQKPFEELGLDNEVELLTLSDGRYVEHFTNDTLRQIGSVMFNTVTNKVEYFITDDELEKMNVANRNREVSRFLSRDPLADKFPMLTPYQFASNTPIWAVDLDGLEGVSYRVVKKDETTGEVTAIKRVIEVDIHLAVNKKGRKGAYSTESAEQLKILMTTKYNEKGYLDDEGLPVEFKLNFNEFDPKTTKPTDLAKTLKSNKTPTNYSQNTFDNEGNAVVKPYESFTDLVMWKEKINANGRTSLNKIQINPSRGIYDFGHAESHELTHFLLLSTGYTLETPKAVDQHSLGGWMQYGTHHIDAYGKTIKIEDVDFNFSQDAFNQILQSVPRVNDKEQE